MGKEAVLANCVGTYAETAPIPALRGHFQCAWTSDLPNEDFGTVAIVPDGCIDLIWRDERFVVVGPDVTAAKPTLQRGEVVLGLRFIPGAAVGWLDLPITEIVGREIDMQDIWGAKARRIAESMRVMEGTGTRLEKLQELLAELAPSVESPPQEGAAMFDFLRISAANDAGGGIRLLARVLDVSERTLRRRSHDMFGYGPKTLHRILRFQAFMASVRSSGAHRLADTAYANGYADQAHLNREIQSLCGMTTGEFVRQITR